MGKPIEVILISGFLGSGKTTFLNRLVRAFPAQLRLLVLMNEFGQVGIDGCLLPDRDLELIEINRGSVFCACVKTDFIKALARIAHRIQPDLLVIEATGVANPAALKRDLGLPLFSDRFRLKEQVCLVDVPYFLDAFDTFVAVERQLESATTVILNKLDQATAEQLAAVRGVIAERVPTRCVWLEARFADVPLGAFLPAPEGYGGQVPAPAADALDEAALGSTIETALPSEDPTAQPADALFSAVYRWCGQDPRELQDLAARFPPNLLRAKGILLNGERATLFSWVAGKVHLEPLTLNSRHRDRGNRIVFVGPREALEQLAQLARTSVHLSVPLFSEPSPWGPPPPGPPRPSAAPGTPRPSAALSDQKPLPGIGL